MANPSKRKGTAFETQVVGYLRKSLSDEHIERCALHGRSDVGDIHGIIANGWNGIAECKDVSRCGDSLLAKWRAQTLVERENARADFALLVEKVPGRPIGRALVHMTEHDLARIRSCERSTGNHSEEIAGEGCWCVHPLELVVGWLAGQTIEKSTSGGNG